MSNVFSSVRTSNVPAALFLQSAFLAKRFCLDFHFCEAAELLGSDSFISAFSVNSVASKTAAAVPELPTPAEETVPPN